jgi:hypothetical protein
MGGIPEVDKHVSFMVEYVEYCTDDILSYFFKSDWHMHSLNKILGRCPYVTILSDDENGIRLGLYNCSSTLRAIETWFVFGEISQFYILVMLYLHLMSPP